MLIYSINKIVLSIQKNPHSLLNGITSNTMEAESNAFLSIHGRIVATFDQVQVNDDQMLIALERHCYDDIKAHMQRYIMLSGVQVEETTYHVYFDLDDSYVIKENEYSVKQKKGKLVFTKDKLDAQVTDDEFTLFRVKNAIALQGVDYNNEMVLNVSTGDFVSFTKGCYLGQEPVSKVYNRAKPSRRLEVKRMDDCTDEEKNKMTSVCSEGGVKHGFVFVKNV
ncbi:MAG: folate-binding protein YgfZ [Candidatus Omnitrophota bacterium]|jgi:folate-binding protein YgfZ